MKSYICLILIFKTRDEQKQSCLIIGQVHVIILKLEKNLPFLRLVAANDKVIKPQHIVREKIFRQIIFNISNIFYPKKPLRA